MTVEDRFWAKVQKTTDCWWWTGARVGPHPTRKYGWFRLDARGGIRAHRFAWMLHFGEVPPGLLVCHSCDNSLCVRPDHLFVGTHADNHADCVTKGRALKACGASHGHAKLTDEIVRQIRAATETQDEIAERFAINQSQISRIRSRKLWTHVG